MGELPAQSFRGRCGLLLMDEVDQELPGRVWLRLVVMDEPNPKLQGRVWLRLLLTDELDPELQGLVSPGLFLRGPP